MRIGGWRTWKRRRLRCLSLIVADQLTASAAAFLGLVCRAWYVLACSADSELSHALVRRNWRVAEVDQKNSKQDREAGILLGLDRLFGPAFPLTCLRARRRVVFAANVRDVHTRWRQLQTHLVHCIGNDL